MQSAAAPLPPCVFTAIADKSSHCPVQFYRRTGPAKVKEVQAHLHSLLEAGRCCGCGSVPPLIAPSVPALRMHPSLRENHAASRATLARVPPGEKVLVFAHHQAVLDELQAGLGRVPFIRIDGGVSSRCSTTALQCSGCCCSQAAGSSAGLRRIRWHVGCRAWGDRPRTCAPAMPSRQPLACPNSALLISPPPDLLSAVAASLWLAR